MSEKINKSEITRNYVEKYIELALRHKRQYSKRYIATVMHNENPDIFKDVEDARKNIRIQTGANGNYSNKSTDLPRQFALIPEAIKEVETTDPFEVPIAYNKSIVINDVHSLFYSRPSLEIAINYGLKHGCNSVIIDGDFMDFYGDSKFDKNPKLTIEFFEREQEWGQDVLKLLQDTFGYVVLKYGNHDARREKRIMQIASQKTELAEYARLSDFLFFDGCAVNFVEDYRHIRYGKLNIVHGHEYFGGGGIHIAHNRLLKAFDNIMSAHSHRGESKVLKDINGQIFGSWAVACMCQLNPRYSSHNNWTNGFALVERDESGDFSVDNRVIYGSKTFPV